MGENRQKIHHMREFWVENGLDHFTELNISCFILSEEEGIGKLGFY